tara:strand:+ start:130 stop:387 length:258 start_codon:yes stop_codon:yes gene_type:complete
MDVFLSFLLLVGGAILAFWLNARNRKLDTEALEREVSQDFEEEYDLSEHSVGTELGPEMEDLIDWIEEDIRLDEESKDEDTFEIR